MSNIVNSAHGTYIKDGGIYASVVGIVEKTNKMITVNPIKTKYNPEGGDLVVGKILELGDRIWRVYLNARNKAILNLNSLNIEGQQRRKTEQDEQQMRDFFKENDIIVAEIQAKHGGKRGAINI